MKITVDNSDKLKKFSDLNVGDVFLVGLHNTVYMRIPYVTDCDNRKVNAVSFRDGRLYYIRETELVSKRKSELIVKEEIH